MIEDYFGASAPEIEFREEAYPGYAAPIIRLAHEDGHPSDRRECIAAVFGLIPAWSKDGKCWVPCDHVPVRSWPLFRARQLMRDVIESFKQDQAL